MSKGKDIRLSKKYGLNPSMLNCFFCGECKGIALMGKLPNDAEAPKAVVADYEPCDRCAKEFERGVLLIAVTTTQPDDNRPACVAKGDIEVYPSGNWAVVTEEAARKMFDNPNFKKGMSAFVDAELLENLLP